MARLGEWAYGRTDGNDYLSGNEEGNYQHAGFALDVAAEYGHRLRVRAQVDWEEFEEEPKAELDYAFAEWVVSDRLRVRGGKVKHPFGIYTEVFDTALLRPFPSLPQSIYGPVGVVAEAYKGLGAAYSREVAGSWWLEADVYGGGLTLDEDETRPESTEELTARLAAGTLDRHTGLIELAVNFAF